MTRHDEEPEKERLASEKRFKDALATLRHATGHIDNNHRMEIYEHLADAAREFVAKAKDIKDDHHLHNAKDKSLRDFLGGVYLLAYNAAKASYFPDKHLQEKMRQAVFDIHDHIKIHYENEVGEAVADFKTIGSLYKGNGPSFRG